MRKVILVAAIVALAACNKQPAAEPANDANMAMDANTADANMAGTALASINETSWEYTDNKTKKPMQESVDATGKYITVSGKEHIDHGTAVMKDGKACFTSAMTKDGETCWSDPMIAEGGSGETTSDKGEKLPIKRVAYVPLTM
ncbi:hypothetical protein [Sphingomonas sp.]|uniref:hypothetical protein n=1 Tax=Sphingomonas sp. TaxID=28214 RepID=UPI00286C9CEF|nr:hypothetical protein [Sphingomonas sp.]